MFSQKNEDRNGLLRDVNEIDPIQEMQEKIEELQDRVSRLEQEKSEMIGPRKSASIRYDKILEDIKALAPTQSIYIKCEDYSDRASTQSCLQSRCKRRGIAVRSVKTEDGVIFVRTK